MNTYKRHSEIYAIASNLVAAAGGAEGIDNMPQDRRRAALASMAQEIIAKTCCVKTTARGNVAKALRISRGILRRQGSV